MISALVLSYWVLDNEIFVLLYWRNARFQECESVFIREGQIDIVGGGQRFSILKNQVSRHKVKENP